VAEKSHHRCLDPGVHRASRNRNQKAFPWNEVPRYLIRDRDSVYGAVVARRMRAMGIRDKPTAPASPWQNC